MLTGAYGCLRMLTGMRRVHAGLTGALLCSLQEIAAAKALKSAQPLVNLAELPSPGDIPTT